MKMGAKRVRELLDAMAGRHILVVGDLMLDRYVYGRVKRISPEAPVPVVEVQREEDMPGGASNVAWNVRALGAKAAVAGLLGSDNEGHALRHLLETRDIDTSLAVENTGWRTSIKTRIVAERQQVVRVDRDATPMPSGADDNRLHGMLGQAVARSDGVIIEDYGKGAVSQQVVNIVLDAARAVDIPVGYDPKPEHPLDVTGITVATPNYDEALALSGLPRGNTKEDNLNQVVDELHRLWRPALLAITLGPRGMLLAPREGKPRLLPTQAREVFDVSGAGDTVIAVLLLALSAGAGHDEAAELANCAAGVVVGKLGTATCTAAELADAAQQAPDTPVVDV